MARSSSSKKVQRAARAAASSRSTRERRELGYPAALVIVVVLGIALVLFSRSTREPAAAPRVGNDHWHSAYGIYDCDRFLPAFQGDYDPDGIHSHSDGVVHIHPWNSSAAGVDATMDIFFEAMFARVTDDEISGPGIGVLEAGSDCNGEPTVIRAVRFGAIGAEQVADAETLQELFVPTEEFDDDFGDIRLLSDLEAFTFARVPANATIPPPPEERLQLALGASAGNLISTGPQTEAEEG